jgi:hypothetical protein
MSTKFGIQSLGLAGFLGFIVGLFYYPKAIALRHAALDSGDDRQVRVAHLLTFLSKILLWGGLVLALISVGCYLLYLKWERDHHDT